MNNTSTLARPTPSEATPAAPTRGGLRVFSTWPPAEDVPAFRGAGAAGRRCALFVLLCMGTLIGVGATVGSLLGDATSLDASVSEWFADHRTGAMNTVTMVFSTLAGTLMVIAIALIVIIGGVLRKSRNGLIVLTIGMVGEVLMFLALTAIVSRPRPDVARLDMAPPTSSFPSGHTFASAVLWGALAIVAYRSHWGTWWRRLFLTLAFILPLLVAFSRVYRGMHHLTDVLASFTFAAIWLVVLVRLFPTQTEDVR